MNLIHKQSVQIAAALVMLLIAVGMVAYNLGGSSAETRLRSPEALMLDAMAEGSSQTQRTRRRQAARELVQQAAEATKALRELADESNDPAVRATALQGLGKARDRDSVPLLLEALEDADPRVRGQANAALIKIYETDFGFRANDPPAKRASAVATWRKACGQL